MIENPDGPIENGPSRYDIRTQPIWKVLFLASSDPNRLMHDEGVTAIQHIQELLANQIHNALDGFEYALAVTVGHGGQPFVLSTNYDESEQESQLTPRTARPGLALDVSSIYEVDGDGPVWLLKIVITVQMVGEINAILDRLNTVTEALPQIVGDSEEIEPVTAAKNLVTDEEGPGTIEGSDRLGRASNGNTWGGGGPGGWPVPMNDIDNTAAPYHFQFHPPLGATSLDSLTGQNVKVIILDTCPTQAVWDAAVTKHVTNAPPGEEHPILQRLAQREGTDFFMYRNPDPAAITVGEELKLDDLRKMYGLPSHSRVDHGIFIAGIIDTIAPDAEIHLVQVMDADGMLLFNSVDDGINTLLTKWRLDNDRDAIIVNMSLNLQLTFDEEMLPRTTKLGYEGNLLYYKRSRIVPQNIETLFIAAAGNEARYVSRPGDEKPPYPRPPASFEAILGVSALETDDSRALYANWADDFDLAPEKESHDDLNTVPRLGIATLGGDILPIDYIDPDGHPSYRAIAHPERGILGLYLSEVFETTIEGLMTVSAVNDKGWARWSGTSFATAITSGLAALVASNLYDTSTSTPASANAVVTEMLTYCDGRLQDTISGVPTDVEHILRVEQTT